MTLVPLPDQYAGRARGWADVEGEPTAKVVMFNWQVRVW